MNQNLSSVLRFCLMVALILASCLTAARPGLERPQGGKPAGSKPAGKSSVAGAPVQTQRNIGKAYYEQGKYTEAIGQFQKIVASGKALATDHFDLGLSLMQANKLDEAFGELTTARQMDPKLVAADYNLGIVYKRELRYPDAEAALKRVIAADPEDPAAWFNLGEVYFAEKRWRMRWRRIGTWSIWVSAKGRTFTSRRLFHTFTTYVRLKRDADAQKALKIHEKMRDKVPGISLQNPRSGRRKIRRHPSACRAAFGTRAERRLEKVTFAEITGRLGLTLPAQQSVPADSQVKLKRRIIRWITRGGIWFRSLGLPWLSGITTATATPTSTSSTPPAPTISCTTTGTGLSPM